MATASELMQEVDQRARAIVAKAATPLSKADPALYARYRAATQTEVGSQPVITKADGSTAPSFGTELLRRQLPVFSAKKGVNHQ